MIELELKYKLNRKPNIQEKITKENDVEDIYYDTQDYTMLRNGNFLRLRNKKSLDFKLNTNDKTHLYCKETNFSVDKFEVEAVSNVLKNIGINTKFKTLDELLKQFQILAPIIKHRKSYNLEDNIVMVIDEVKDLGTFLEIEYDIDKESITKEEADYYKDYLVNILKKREFITSDDEEVHIGYVELYLKKYNVDAFNLGIYK